MKRAGAAWVALAGYLPHPFARGMAIAWGALALALAFTLASWRYAAVGAEREASQRFEFETLDVRDAIRERMATYEQALRAAAALFAASISVERHEWKSYVDSLRLQQRFPGIQGMGYARVVSASEREAHVRAVRAEGFPDYSLRPAGERDAYTAIIYIEPFSERNRGVLGYDMFSEPVRRAAMERARDTGEAALSARVGLMQDLHTDRQAASLMYLPIYQNGSPHATVAQRRAALVGYVYAPFRMKDLMSGILGVRPAHLDLEIYDGTNVSPAALMYDDARHGHDPARFLRDVALEVNGRTWTLRISSTPSFEAQTAIVYPWLMLAGGIAVSVLVFLIVVSLVAIREKEVRARSILGSALDAIVIIDRSGRVVEFNPSAVRVFGYSRSDALGRELAELVIPSAFREPHRRGLARYLATGQSQIMGRRLEMSALRADGGEIPVELTVVPVAGAGELLFAGFVRDISERKRAEEALRESEARNKAIVESALDAIIVNDERGRITELNPSAERILGWRREQAIGRNLAEVIIPERFRHLQRQDLASGTVQFQGRRVEMTALHADGHEFPIELTVQRIERGGRPHFAAFMRDISERRRAEEALSESELELRTIFDSVQDGVLVADAQTRRFRKANASIVRMLGYSPDELLDLTVEAIHPEKDLPNVVREFERLMKGEIRIAPNLPVKRKDGTVFQADISAAPVTLRGQSHLLGVFRDITESKRAAAILRESEEMYRALFESTQDAIMTLAPPSWAFTSGNPATVRMFAVRDEAEFVSLGPWQLSPETQPDGRPSSEKAPEMIGIAMREGAHFFEWTHQRLGGESFPATVLLTRVSLGGQVFLQATVRDISEEKRAQEALSRANAALALQYRLLEEADRAKSEFMANVTHELRTPLNSVIGFAELLKDQVPGPLNAKQAAFAADIVASGQHLLALVDGILEMSRLDAAGAALEREQVEIGAVLEERVAAQRRAAEARGVTMRLEVAPEAGSAELDPRALRHMFDALLDNAIKFNREGGSVAVSARRTDGTLEIAVTDTGIGIAREGSASIFKPFVQLDAGLARRHGGVGLGLALARRLAEMHGGTIEVESEPGKGSTFTLRLPAGERNGGEK